MVLTIAFLCGCEGGSGCKGDAIGGKDAAAGGDVVPSALPKLFKNREVLFVGGLMSELYDQLSVNLENEINDELDRTARALNVHIDLPGDRDIDLPIGDAIADALPEVDLPIRPGRFTSFYTQMQVFEAAGIPFRNVSLVSPSFDTSESVEHNARAIREAIRAADRPVIVVSHSKGGLDTLEALLAVPGFWGQKVVGWVALHPPFHGSPLADPAPSAVHDLFSRVVGGNGQALDDLKTTTRAVYMDANAERIAELTAAIPVISAYSVYEADGTVGDFASAFASRVFDPSVVSEITDIVVENYRATPSDLARVISASTAAALAIIRDRIATGTSEAVSTISLLNFTNVYLNLRDLPNDGLVPKDSTVLPGATHRALDVSDHASPVMDVDPFKNFWTAEHRNRITAELIAEVNRAAKQPP
jgi:triacylglycerol esterase/lipase EstA (alpha/beta hydrolase family)